MTALQAERPLVSVIIPCRNEAECIEGCLASVLAQEEPAGGFEVIIADGMSEDGTREAIGKAESRKQKAEIDSEGAKARRTEQKVESSEEKQKAESRKQKSQSGEVGGQWSVVSSQPSVVSGPAIRVIDNPGKIVSTGLNAAIRAARGDIIIRMDAHTEYAPDYIRRCVETLQRTGAENVGGPARTRAETFLERAVAAAYHSPFSVGGARFHDIGYVGWVDTVTYGCWPREVFERFGYFDEELVRDQDDEHNLRIMRGGGRIWQNPEIKSWYHPRGSLGALFRQYLQYGYWKVRVIQKHKLPASWRHLVPGAFLLTLLSLFLLSAFSFLLSALRLPSSDPWSLGRLVPWSVVTGPVHFCFLLSTFCFVSLLLLYGVADLMASVLTAARTEWKLLPVLPFVFGCYHFGYAWGFLRGVLDFVVLRRGAGIGLTEVTRTSRASANDAGRA
ncbi:MAG: glycosyltransferase family 2 protein [Limisphaerales bacterium]